MGARRTFFASRDRPRARRGSTRARLSSRRLFSGLAGARACRFLPRAELRLPRIARSRTCRRRTRRSVVARRRRPRPSPRRRARRSGRSCGTRPCAIGACASRGASGGRRAGRRARVEALSDRALGAAVATVVDELDAAHLRPTGIRSRLEEGVDVGVSQPGDPVIERQVRRAVAGVYHTRRGLNPVRGAGRSVRGRALIVPRPSRAAPTYQSRRVRWSPNLIVTFDTSSSSASRTPARSATSPWRRASRRPRRRPRRSSRSWAG